MSGQDSSRLEQSLFEAVDTGQVQPIEQLIAQGAGANARNAFGMPVLVIAVSRQNEWVIRELLLCGADPNCRCETPQNKALLILSPNKRHLRSQPEDNKTRWAGWTPLMEASRGRAHHLIKQLVRHGANPNLATDNGYTALMEAATLGLASIAHTMLENGAKVDARRKDGRTALHHASSRGYLDVMKELLSAGANVNATDANGITPLMHAVRRSREATALLLQQGANASMGTKQLESAHSWAAAAGHAEILSLLLKCTGEDFLQGVYGDAVIRRARSSGCKEVCQIVGGYDGRPISDNRLTTQSIRRRRR